MQRYLLIFAILLLATPVAAAVSFTVPSAFDMTLGESVTLTGTADSTTVIYLFMTGPGLNSNGVSLTDIQALAETGNYIRVPVTPDGRWKYTWYTQGISGRSGMEAGIYRIYATDLPLAARALPGCSGCSYTSIDIQVTKPSIQLPSGPAAGTLDLRSSVSGLTIYIDGAPWGTIPTVISGIPQGQRVIELRSDNYYSLSEEIIVTTGTTVITINPIPFPKTGTIRVSSDPEGELVYLNGAPVGMRTPAELTSISTGQQIIDLKPAGYNTWTRTVTVYPGKTEMLTANLVYPGAPETISPTMSPPPGETGSLHVSSTPVGSKVTVSGQLYGVTPLFIDTLTPGTYELTISHDGYIPWSTSVLVDTAFTIELSPSLQPIPQPTPSPFPILTVIGALLLFPLFFRRR
jgi:hypothetical protein